MRWWKCGAECAGGVGEGPSTIHSRRSQYEMRVPEGPDDEYGNAPVASSSSVMPRDHTSESYLPP